MPAVVTIFQRVLVLTICCAALVTAGGCVGVAALLEKTQDPTEKATYVPDKDNMLILVEDYQNPALVELVADHMNRLIAEEFINNRVCPIVNPDRLSTFRSDHQDTYRKMETYAIGSELGARQVLYVNITEFAVEAVPGSELRKGHAEAWVKIIDSRTKLPRWPRDGVGAGYQVSVNIPFASNDGRASDKALRNVVARELSLRVSRLFYDAIVKEPDPAPSYPEADLP